MSVNNVQRTVKNTLFLYARMILVMLVSLYTVRVVLEALGVVDYGIYNIVGGVVTTLSFFGASLSGACQRYFSFDIGKGNLLGLHKTFCVSISIFILLGIILFIFLETVGFWFLNNKIIIPSDRIDVAHYVYQFSILTFLLTTITIPFNSLLIANEYMKIYAYFGILDVILKLAIVFCLKVLIFDKLLLYGLLIFMSTFLVTSITIFCVRKKFVEARNLKMVFKIDEIKPLMSYASWNVVGATSTVLKNNGTNILLNMFFGPIVNAARGLSMQINDAIGSFIVNIYLAVRPQITKAYAVDNLDLFLKLTITSAKASYYLIFLLTIPVLFETSFILNLWLDDVPHYTVIFVKLILINLLLESVTNQLYGAIQSTGRIRLYQLIYCSMLLLILPLTYLFFRLGYTPEYSIYLSIFITVVGYFPQLLLAEKIANIPIKTFTKDVILNVTIISILSLITPIVIINYLPSGISRFMLLTFSSSLVSISIMYLLGLNTKEKIFLIQMIKKEKNG